MSEKMIVPFVALVAALGFLEYTETISIGWEWVVMPVFLYIGLYFSPLIVAAILIVLAALLAVIGLVITIVVAVVAAVLSFFGNLLSKS